MRKSRASLLPVMRLVNLILTIVLVVRRLSDQATTLDDGTLYAAI